MSMFEIIQYVRDGGGHVRIPSNAPQVVQEIMEGVFKKEPTERLTMEEIYSKL